MSIYLHEHKEFPNLLHNSPKLTPYFQSKLTPLKVIDILSSKYLNDV